MDGVLSQGTGTGIDQPLSEHGLHGPAFVQEDPHITTGFSQTERFGKFDERLDRFALRI